MELKINATDIRWWFWAVTLEFIIAAVSGWAPGYMVVIAISAVQVVFFLLQEKSLVSFPVQIRLVYFAFTLFGLWPEVGWYIYLILLLGTSMVAFFGLLWLAVNWIYQVVRKPSELLFPVSGVLYRTPSETWNAYRSVFRRHSTAVITPEFVAALAQVEGSGNPIVRTYWRWSLTHQPFEVYRPASSAVGMYQITDGTFEEARRYCIHDHVVVEDGPWHDMRSCWFNALYTRVIASHAVEMTSAYLDRRVARALTRAGISSATLRHKQDLAAVIHLCGAGAGERYARRGLRLVAGQRCGDHDVGGYLARVQRMKSVFARLGAVS